MLNLKTTKGFILPIVLILLLLLAILSLAIAQTNLSETRMTNNEIDYSQIYNAAEMSLIEIENTVLTSNDFKIAEINVPTIADLNSNAWWQAHAQAYIFSTIKVQYVISIVQTDPCVKIQNSSKLGAIFYQIDVRAIGNNQQQVVLESHLAKSNVQLPVCNKVKIDSNAVLDGKMSWQRIL